MAYLGALNTRRCIHGRYRIDPCLGCGRRYERGVLTGPFVQVLPEHRRG